MIPNLSASALLMIANAIVYAIAALRIAAALGAW